MHATPPRGSPRPDGFRSNMKRRSEAMARSSLSTASSNRSATTGSPIRWAMPCRPRPTAKRSWMMASCRSRAIRSRSSITATRRSRCCSRAVETAAPAITAIASTIAWSSSVNPPGLLGQVEVAEYLAADPDRDSEEAVHRRMAGRETDRVGMLGDLGDADGLAHPGDGAEHTTTFGEVPDPGDGRSRPSPRGRSRRASRAYPRIPSAA